MRSTIKAPQMTKGKRGVSEDIKLSVFKTVSTITRTAVPIFTSAVLIFGLQSPQPFLIL